MFKKVSVFVLCMSLLMETGAGMAFGANRKRAAGTKKKRAAARKVVSSKSTKSATASVPTSVIDDVTETVAETTELVVPATTGTANTIDSENFDPSKPIATPRLDAAVGVGDLFAKQNEAEKKKMQEEINESAVNLNRLIDEGQPTCSGIKANLDKIFGLVTASTISSAAGTVAAGSALAVGLIKSSKDKKAAAASTDAVKGIVIGDDLTEKDFNNQLDDLVNIATGGDDYSKKSKSLGNARTALMATATATSAVSLGTSIASSMNAAQLADKMVECDKKVGAIKSEKSNAQAIYDSYIIEADGKYSGVNATALDSALKKAEGISQNCTGYDKNNISTLKNKMTASAIVSGIGTATGAAGTTTSVLANTNKMATEENKGKKKGFDIASNVLAGVTAGTSGATAILSGTALENAKRDSDMSGRCEEAFNAVY